MNSKNSGATPAANKVFLKRTGIADFSNNAAVEGPNHKSRNCPVAEICTPTAVSLSSNSLSWDHTISLPLHKVYFNTLTAPGRSRELKIHWSMVFFQIKGEVVCQMLKMNLK